MKSRADFSAQIRTLVARRAGYQCSVPTCRRLTIGPGAGPSQVADIGVASHIYSAARNGPRGSGGLSFEQRRSADNAIWLCADHGRLIDTNAGGQYPASVLQSWKGLHEAFCRLEMGGQTRPFGWMESLKITEAPALLAGREFYFSSRNLIVGENATGKTILTDIIAGIGKPSLLAKYARDRGLSARIRWYDPGPHDLTFAAIDGRVSHDLDGRRVPYVAKPYRTVLLSGDGLARCQTLGDLALALDSDPTTVANVLAELPKRVNGNIVGVKIAGDSVQFKIKDDPGGWVELSDLQIYPRGLIFLPLELALAFAQVQAEVEPTLLVIDEIMGALDQAAMRNIYSFFANGNYAFQIVMATVSDPPEDCRSEWLITEFNHDA